MNDDRAGAYLSDVAVHHAEVLYGHGTPTVAALADLARIAEALVLHETVAVSPNAYLGSSLLQRLDFVHDPTPLVNGVPADPRSTVHLRRPPRDSDAASAPITIDADASGELFSAQPAGRVLLAHLAAESLQDAPALANLVEPRAIEAGRDRGLYCLDKLVQFVLLLQWRQGALPLASKAAGRSFGREVRPSLQAYERYVARVVQLQEVDGVEPVFSSLEEGLAAAIRTDRSIAAVETPAFWDSFRSRLDTAAAGDRSPYFQRWRLPAFGLMALGLARKLDDLPRVIQRLRKTFLAVRRELAQLQRDKQALLGAAGGLDDRGWREAVRIDQRVKKALEAFDATLADSRIGPDIRRADWVFNMPKYLGWLCSFGIGSVGHVLEFANLRRRGAAADDDDTLRIGHDAGELVIPHNMLWAQLSLQAPLRQLLLYPPGLAR